MSQSIVSRGKCVNDAVEMGLTILGAAREEVSIEILEMETKKFLRAKPAVVRITKQKSSTKPKKEHNWESMIDEQLDDTSTSLEEVIEELFKEEKGLKGMVEIKNGQIIGQPSPTQFPTISTGKYIKLYKNGFLSEGTTIVEEGDHFEIKVDSEETETKWRIEMDSAHLAVTLHVEPGVKIIRSVKDCPPAQHVFLEAQEVRSSQNTLTYEAIINKLESLNVIHGFHHQEMMKAIETDKPGSFVVAKGIESIEGQNGYLEVISAFEDKENGPKKRANGTVDFREIRSVPSVSQGQVIALVHPPIPGIPGKTVTNKPLPAKQTFPLVIQTGKGVMLVETDGVGKLVASESGRPYLEKSGQLVKISIMQKMVYSGDVTIESGNIRFNGDVDILGNVENSMLVEADGVIQISENVNMATIISKSSVLISRNVIGSTISAGKDNMYISELVYILDAVEQNVGKLIQSIDQLRKVPAWKLSDYEKNGLLPLLKLLMEKKFSTLKGLIQQFLEIAEKGDQWISTDWKDMSEDLRMCFLSSIPNKWHSFDALHTLLHDLGVLHDQYKIADETGSAVELLYSLNSNIFSSGDVMVFGQGCYNSKVHAGGTVRINGVLRGGDVFAREGVFVKEAGSVSGVGTRIVVPQGKTISMNLAREGTVIQIGKVCHKFSQDVTHFSAYVDENGRIGFHSTGRESKLHVQI
ncbi:FapA family protein [Falsibacillus pallidus]|uniref:RNA-binding protein KhpB N-terminal domain-containing protein n=1 Tax=Falsibacillus pallidus TaxID=493781 RepID=A0A370G898_9BACI|nr:FapA family protein [Falsibacillus pallidus]RDI40022.1 hypothetical protein DFR59_11345 [Falsibacillus pallidus]